MASGFITLPDGSDWSSRWSGYDWVLETIMNELADTGDEAVLKAWIKYILPNEDNGDIESGYCFYKKSGESVLRIIDTRFMKDKFAVIFWNTVSVLSQKLSNDPDIGYLINRLHQRYEESLKNDFKSPEEDEDFKEIFLLGGFEMAK